MGSWREFALAMGGRRTRALAWLALASCCLSWRASAFCPHLSLRYAGSSSRAQRGRASRLPVRAAEDADEGVEFGADALTRRIQEIQEAKAKSIDKLAEGLNQRADELRAADAVKALVLASPQSRNASAVRLPVIAFDALLPQQRLSGSTQDETFCRLLRDLGIGGIFVMVSWDPYKRRVRRNGVICQVELCDALKQASPLDPSDPRSVPTSVDFIVTGCAPCRVRGLATGMVERIGRWRREHDSNCEEPVLGWGSECFLDVEKESASVKEDVAHEGRDCELPCTVWTSSEIECMPISDADQQDVLPETMSLAEAILPLLDRWLSLASDPRTYDGAPVTAMADCDPGKRLEAVLQDLGPRPPPSRPSALAFWGAALINPLPPLGVSLEIRGRLLEASTPLEKLSILHQGLVRSIINLEGSRPL